MYSINPVDFPVKKRATNFTILVVATVVCIASSFFSGWNRVYPVDVTVKKRVTTVGVAVVVCVSK